MVRNNKIESKIKKKAFIISGGRYGQAILEQGFWN
jgi:hypothetical protein